MASEKLAPDPRVLRAIAHPVRARILDQLGASGSLRAADLARDLDIPANQASFHLRQLAKYGLIVEDPDAARDRRDRVWKLGSPDGLRLDLDEFAAQPGGRAAVGVFRRTMAARLAYLVQRALGDQDAEAPDRHSRTITETAIRLTREERDRFREEFEGLLDSWKHRTVGTGDGRETYSFVAMLQDYPPAFAADEGDEDA